MKKDPAFLFYGKDFYEGTRTMLPEERACLIDLLIYQHQNGGYIPNDLKRISLYCSGIDEAILTATLQAKFKLGDNGWYSERLQELTKERKEYAEKQSINGKVGQFYKQSAKKLSPKEIKLIKEQIANKKLNNKELYENWISKYSDPKAMLKALLKHLGNGSVIGDEDIIVINGKEGMGEKPNPVLPFPSAEFSSQWDNWKNYQATQHSYHYLSLESEQAALLSLNTLSQHNETTAIAILHQSMAQGWKGLFELKSHGNAGKPPAGRKSKAGYSDGFKRKIAERLRSG